MLSEKSSTLLMCSIPSDLANLAARGFHVDLEYPMENIKYVITKNRKEGTSFVQGHFSGIINLFMLGVMNTGLKKLFRNHCN